MPRRRKTLARTLFESVVALAFVTYAANAMGWGERYLSYLASLFWQPVSIELTSLSLDEKQHSGVKVDYNFQLNGQHYSSSQVRVLENSWLERDQALEIYAQLRAQQNSGDIKGWVNPENPRQSILDRNFLHLDSLHGIIFSLVFMLFPLLIVWLPLLFQRKSTTHKAGNEAASSASSSVKATAQASAVTPSATSKAATADVWSGRSSQATSQAELQKLAEKSVISSGEKSGYKVLLAFGAGFFAFSMLFVIPVMQDALNGKYIALLVLIFPAVSLMLILQALSQRKRFLEVGVTPLKPDPLPGFVGGQVGGSFTVTGRFTSPVETTLSCIHSYYTGSGDNRRETRDILWQSESQGYIKQARALSSELTEVQFVFDTPKGLPGSGDHQQNYSGEIIWKLQTHATYQAKGKSDSQKFERSWQLPVANSANNSDSLQQKSSLQIPQEFIDQSELQIEQQAESEVLEQILVEQNAQGLRLYSAAMRMFKMKSPFLLVGIVFFAVGIFMSALDSTGLLMGVIFLLVGGLATAFSAWSLGRQLDVIISGSDVYIKRSWAGITLSNKHFVLNDTSHIQLKHGATITSGDKQTQMVSLVIESQGSKLPIAEGIAGEREAEALKQFIQEKLKSTGMAA